MKTWIKARMKERTSWDGAALIALGLMVLFLAPLAKIAAGLAVAYGMDYLEKRLKLPNR